MIPDEENPFSHGQNLLKGRPHSWSPLLVAVPFGLFYAWRITPREVEG